jgi:hypothetical protein
MPTKSFRGTLVLPYSTVSFARLGIGKRIEERSTCHQRTPLDQAFDLQRLSTVGHLDHSKAQLGPHVLAGRTIERKFAGGDVVDPVAHGGQHEPVANVDAELITAAPPAGMTVQTAERSGAMSCGGFAPTCHPDIDELAGTFQTV